MMEGFLGGNAFSREDCEVLTIMEAQSASFGHWEMTQPVEAARVDGGPPVPAPAPAPAGGCLPQQAPPDGASRLTRLRGEGESHSRSTGR